MGIRYAMIAMKVKSLTLESARWTIVSPMINPIIFVMVIANHVMRYTPIKNPVVTKIQLIDID